MFRIPRVCDIRTWVRDIQNTRINSATIATHDTILIRSPRTKNTKIFDYQRKLFLVTKIHPRAPDIYKYLSECYSWRPSVMRANIWRDTGLCVTRRPLPGLSRHVWPQRPCVTRHAAVTRANLEEVSSGVKIPRGFGEMRDERGKLWQH